MNSGQKARYLVRPARREDAELATALVRASITELCTEDHGGDPAILERWLANKQPEIFETWRTNPSNYIAVAEAEPGVLACVGCVNRQGQILLCYAHPEHRGKGAGSATLCELEAQARRWNLSELRLSSTSNARAFYDRHGFVSSGEPRASHGVASAYPYSKRLADGASAPPTG